MIALLGLLGGIATFIQIAFWLRAGHLLRPSMRKKSAQPFVTVLICARNEAANLQNYLPEILKQQYPHFEVLVADDASSDETPQVLAKMKQQSPHLRSLRLEQKTQGGKKEILELGLSQAHSEWVLLTDADCRPASRHWIATMIEAVEPNIDLVLGYGAAEHPETPIEYWFSFETFYTGVLYLSFARAGSPYMGVGRNLLYRRELALSQLQNTAGQTLAGGDDDLLVNRIARAENTAVVLHPQSFTLTHSPKSFNAWWRQKNRHLATGKYYRPAHRFALGALALSQAAHYLCILWLLILGAVLPAFLLYLVRIIVFWPIAAQLAVRLHAHNIRSWLPLFDALLPIYYLLFTQSIFLKWRSKSW